jgi:ribonuclease P/MRP protein subunit RPP1
MKHTLLRTAIKNGSVFEINYVGALGGQHDGIIMDAGVGETGAGAKRNWWAAAREIVRVTKGKNLLLSGGVASSGDLRAPRDVGNLYVAYSFVVQVLLTLICRVTMLGLPQDVAHAMSTTNAKSLVLRAREYSTSVVHAYLLKIFEKREKLTGPSSQNLDS